MLFNFGLQGSHRPHTSEEVWRKCLQLVGGQDPDLLRQQVRWRNKNPCIGGLDVFEELGGHQREVN